MTEHDLSEMSEEDLQRHLKHYLGIEAFWDAGDHNRVQVLVSKLKAEIAKRDTMRKL
jgi:hypothetical protein